MYRYMHVNKAVSTEKMLNFTNFIAVRLNRTKFVLYLGSWIGKLLDGLSSLSGCFPVRGVGPFD